MIKKQLILPIEGEVIENKFGNEKIRKQFHQNEWWFCVSDIINSLIDSKDRKVKDETAYWRQLKNKLKKEGANQIVKNCHELKIPSKKDGKKYPTDCLNIEGILRIIQSIPSPKAEPMKRWLAKIGFERIEEKQNPELAIKRAILEYELQGRDKQWIQERVEGIIVRNNLTSEWQKRNITNHGKEKLKDKEYGILTNIIAQGTFDISIKKYKHIKNLKKNDNLRENMTNIELLFNRLGEYTALINTKEKNAQGFYENLEAAKSGGKSAGKAREAYERETKIKVVSSENFLIKVTQNKMNVIENFENKLCENGVTNIKNFKRHANKKVTNKARIKESQLKDKE